MDLEELNRQMSFFQDDYRQNQQQPPKYQDINTINFPQPLDSPMSATQIKRPTKTSDTNRSEINEKMAQMRINQPMMSVPNQFNIVPNNNQTTRNNSRYQDSNNQINGINTNNNPLSSYFQQNYSTLNGRAPSNMQQAQMPDNMYSRNDGFNTHEGGQSFVNPSNLPVYSPPPNQTINQQQPGNGYHPIEEKRIDYRQNMNSKVGNFIFDNPNAARYDPNIVAGNPNYNNNSSSFNTRDTRMVIQDSSKDFYRQEANSRMSQYSPLTRASNVPINIANMSVNDFYSNMNPNPMNPNQSSSSYQNAEEDAKAVLSARMSSYSPLAKASPLQTHPTQQTQSPMQYPPAQYNQQQLPPAQYNQKQQQQLTKPPTWLDNNVNITNPLVAHEELPIISH